MGWAVAFAALTAHAQVVVFADGFESGGGWTTSDDASISTTSYAGSYAAQVDDTGSVATVVDTTGLDSMTFEEAAPLVVACESDATAPVRSRALPFYGCIPSSNEKAFLDEDTRYHELPCGAPHQADLVGLEISDDRDTCPYQPNGRMRRPSARRSADSGADLGRAVCPPPALAGC